MLLGDRNRPIESSAYPFVINKCGCVGQLGTRRWGFVYARKFHIAFPDKGVNRFQTAASTWEWARPVPDMSSGPAPFRWNQIIHIPSGTNEGEPASAGYGLLASSRDKDLCSFGIPNDYFSTRRVRHGHWYNDDEIDLGQLSRRHLKQCVTEFGAQASGLTQLCLHGEPTFRSSKTVGQSRKVEITFVKATQKLGTQRNCAPKHTVCCSRAAAMRM